ncbi:MAG TPA: hypothetical protein VF719_08855 [Abditibacteriaceae bacterium]|jgi:hypothetical protein
MSEAYEDEQIKRPQKTGHPIVDVITTMRFKGIVIDHRWIGHKWLCRTEGKKVKAGLTTGFDRDAAYVLAEICYFYSAKIEKGAEDHQVRVSKRFDGDTMYQNYETWAHKLGCTDRELRDIIAFLKKNGLIGFESKPVTLRNGVTTNNLPHIWPIPEKIYEMTYGAPPKNFGGGVSKKREAPSKNFTSDENSSDDSQINEEGVSNFRDPSTVHTPTVCTRQQQHGAGAPNADVVFDADASNDNQAKNTPNNAQAKKSAGAGDPREAEILQRLIDLGTSASSSTLRKLVRENSDHAAFVAEHFPHEQENSEEYWLDHKGTRAAALVLRLQDTTWQPRYLAKERAAEERKERARIEAQRRQDLQQFNAALLEREAQEKTEFERKQALATMQRFYALSKAKRESIVAQVKSRDLIFIQKAPGGDPLKIKPESAWFCSMATAVAEAMAELAQAKPQLPGLAQRAAGEYHDEADGVEIPVDVEALIERTIERYVSAVAEGTFTVEALDSERQYYDFSPEQWERVRAEVTRRVAQNEANAQAAAKIGAEPELPKITAAENDNLQRHLLPALFADLRNCHDDESRGVAVRAFIRRTNAQGGPRLKENIVAHIEHHSREFVSHNPPAEQAA